MFTLEDAVALAANAHRDQTDKAGAPYLLHVLRVMMKMPTYEGKMIAVLHDIIEDTEVTIDELRKRGCSEWVIRAVSVLTHTPNQPYQDYIAQIVAFCVATDDGLVVAIKLADLDDNLNMARLLIHDKSGDLERMVTKYLQAKKTLLNSLIVLEPST